MIRVFPRRTKWTPTDGLAFVGDPPLFLSDPQPVKISVTFTWDLEEGYRLLRAWRRHYKSVEIGGPAFGGNGEFVPGRFIKQGVTFTSRGCPWSCPFCLVPIREGKIKELPIIPGHIVQDNNLLACSQGHIMSVFQMLEKQRGIVFAGGLDSRLIKPWHIRAFNDLSIKEMWFAADSDARMVDLERVANLMVDIPINKKRCFVLVGFNSESTKTAEKRLRKVLELGFLPFVQYYRGPEEKEFYPPREWRRFLRTWSRPAAYRSQCP